MYVNGTSALVKLRLVKYLLCEECLVFKFKENLDIVIGLLHNWSYQRVIFRLNKSC